MLMASSLTEIRLSANTSRGPAQRSGSGAESGAKRAGSGQTDRVRSAINLSPMIPL
jgi:hypothetical protein